MPNGKINREGDAQISLSSYKGEQDLPAMISLIERDLSEPYSIYTYRFFLNQWPQHCWLAHSYNEEYIRETSGNENKESIASPCIGVIVCKLDLRQPKSNAPTSPRKRGYIAMLAVDQAYRHRGVGSRLVMQAIKSMAEADADEIILEAELSNAGALALYSKLGFIRDKRLDRYYMNGVDAYRLKLWLK